MKRLALVSVSLLLITAGIASAGYSTTGSSGEVSTLEIFRNLYGAGMGGDNWCGSAYTDGTITATRVEDYTDPYSQPGTPGDNLYLLSTSLLSTATDQLWVDGVATVTARARYAGYQQQLGYDDGSGYVEILDVGDNTGFINISAGPIFFPPGTTWQWVRKGEGLTWSSKEDDNSDDLDHLITYYVTGLNDGKITWVVFWDDEASGGDRDFNDFVLVITAQTIVPNIVGQEPPDANSVIIEASLVVGTIDYDYNDTVAAGLVLSQNPAAGTSVPAGSAVNYTVSSGQPVVPYIINMTRTDANSTITAVDSLVVGTIDYDYNDTVAAGLVLSQNPAAGTSVPAGSAVNYTVSSGQPVVPYIINMTKTDANSTITGVDSLVVGTIDYDYNDTVAAGLVLSQNPAAGTSVPAGSAVNYTVSSGQPVVPYIINMTKTDANSTITGVDSLVVGTIDYDYNDTVAAGLVLSQNPAAGTSVPAGSAVNYTVSSGQPVVPYIINMTKTDANSTITGVDSLVVGTIDYDYNDTVAAGLVLSQNPAAGTSVPAGSAVNYTVSSGQPVVPYIINMTRTDANSTITGVDSLVVGTIDYDYNDTVAAGLVLSQNPAAGTSVPAGSAVNYTVSSGQPVVPYIINMTRTDANSTITGVDSLVVGTIDYDYNDTVAAGLVLSQNPAAGTSVPAGSAVNYTVSSGQPVVPYIINMTRTDANSTITGVDSLVVGTIDYDYNDTVAAGLVLSQNPAAGTSVPAGSAVNYTVSSGQPVVPYIINMTRTDANSTITGVDSLVVGTIDYDYNDTVAAGLVLSQNPAAGTSVPAGSAVNYTVSSGQPVVPYIINMTRTDANSTITGVDSLVVGTIDYDYNDTVAAGLVLSQNPAAGTSVPAGSAVNYTVSSGQPVVPYIINMTRTDANSTITGVDSLVVGTIDYDYNDTVAAGLVLSQNPAAGTSVPAGSAVNYTVSSGQPVVPYIINMTKTDANSTITGVDSLVVGTIDYDYNDTVAAGLVLSQNPAAGTSVPAGSAVNYTVSSGQPVVPYIINMTRTDANSTITGVDSLVVGTIDYDYNDTVAAGLVLSQNPAAGTSVPAGSAVNYTVSSGQPVVPYIINMTRTDANSTITGVDSLVVGTIDYDYNDTVAAGLVLSQNPAAGTSVPAGSAVNYTVSSGQPVVPYIINMTRTDANSTITGVDSLVVGTIDYDYNDTVAAGLVLSQNPAAGTSVPAGSAVNYTVSSGQPVVPYIINMTRTDANSTITGVDSLVVGTIDYDYNDTVAAGLVLSQNPAAGTSVPAGSAVNYTVSSGQPVVPYIINMTRTDANSTITGVDSLVVGTIDYDYNDTVAAGLVLSQNPAAGTSVPAGSAVNYTVSSGQPVVPYIINMTKTDANSTITAVDSLVVGTIDYDYNDTVAAGLVLSQNPAAGTSVPAGSAVNYTVSSGQPVVPYIINMTRTDANSTITGVDSLVVGTIDYDYNDTVAAGLVLSQNPAAGTSVPAGSAVNYTVSSGQPVVPYIINMTKTDANSTITAVDSLVVGTIDYDYNDTVAAGLVLSQNPAAGTSVPAGSAVNYTVSLGAHTYTITGVSGANGSISPAGDTNVNHGNDLMLEAAPDSCYEVNTWYLDGNDLEINDVSYTLTNITANHTIEATFKLLQVIVPDVLDITEAQAEAALNAVGLEKGDVTYVYSATPEGLVMDQDPNGGTSVACGSSVNLVVSMIDVYVWTNESPYSVLWIDPLNWDPNGVPGEGDTAIINPLPEQGPVVEQDMSVGYIDGSRWTDGGDRWDIGNARFEKYGWDFDSNQIIQIVSGYSSIGKWQTSNTGTGTSTINIGLGIGFGDPCVHINDGFRAFTDGDADGEAYLNIGGNSYVYINDGFEIFTDGDAEGYFEINIGDTATVDIDGGMRLEEDAEGAECQLTVSGSATLNVFGQLRHSDKGTQRILITDDAYVYVDDTFRGADSDEGSDETHITGNAHVVANNGWESQDGTTLWTVDGNALVEVFGSDMYWRNGSLNIGGTATVLVEKDLQLDEGITVFNMYDCGPHVVCEGLGLPSSDDSEFATFNLHGGLIEIGENGIYHENDDWQIDICGCGVMVIDGDVVDEIWEGVDDGKITICGYYAGCGSQGDLMVEYDPNDDKTTVWAEVDPNRAYNPDPICCTDPDAEPVPQELCLTWDAGASAEEHYVFLHTNIDKLTTPGDLSALVAITEETEYCTEPLILGATYYWRVDEVWDCGTTVGQVWCFVVTSCISFDDMESYDNADPNNYIWATWVEGSGDVHGQGGNGTGSFMYTATDPVHTGEKSMEYFYNSTGWEREYAYSEVQKPLDPAENFADNGEKVLVLWFYGGPDNITESMWVALTDGSANTALSTYGILVDSPDDIKNAEWKDWVIDLQDFVDGGVNLEDIVEIAIGFGERGRDGEYPGDPVGVVYFDDISLCSTLCVPRYAPDADINDDCVVDWEDVEEMVEDWLEDLR